MKFKPTKDLEFFQPKIPNKGTRTIETEQKCVTFMKEYSDKSLEELRLEDYVGMNKFKEGHDSDDENEKITLKSFSTSFN